jgi:hypothetical protein
MSLNVEEILKYNGSRVKGKVKKESVSDSHLGEWGLSLSIALSPK